MKSPFPGMDPYLEQRWRGVHANLVSLAQNALNRSLPDDLVARMEERVLIDHAGTPLTRVIYPDVRVYEDQNFPSGPSAQLLETVAVAEPIILELDVEPATETYVTIMSADGEELVTVLEFLSPSNKLAGPDRDAYIGKRADLIAAKVNLIEIDLLRAGPWRQLLAPYVVQQRYVSTYRVITRRVHPSLRVELYPISLRARLPRIPIPLRASDADVVLDLQSLLEQAYENGRYDRTRYDRPCEPPLEGDDAAWAEVLLRTGKR